MASDVYDLCAKHFAPMINMCMKNLCVFTNCDSSLLMRCKCDLLFGVLPLCFPTSAFMSLSLSLFLLPVYIGLYILCSGSAFFFMSLAWPISELCCFSMFLSRATCYFSLAVASIDCFPGITFLCSGLLLKLFFRFFLVTCP